MIDGCTKRLIRHPRHPAAILLRSVPRVKVCSPDRTGARLQREVSDVRVAAMSLEHFIGDPVAGTLVIVPGGRADILLASLVASRFPTVPVVAGILLTGAYEPAGPIVRR